VLLGILVHFSWAPNNGNVNQLTARYAYCMSVHDLFMCENITCFQHDLSAHNFMTFSNTATRQRQVRLFPFSMMLITRNEVVVVGWLVVGEGINIKRLNWLLEYLWATHIFLYSHSSPFSQFSPFFLKVAY